MKNFISIITLVVLFVLSSGDISSSSEMLGMVVLTDQALVAKLQKEQVPVYYRTDDFVLIGLDSIHQQSAIGATILDRQAWSDGSEYYWVLSLPGAQLAPHTIQGITIVFRHNKRTLIKTQPKIAHGLPRCGFEIVWVSRTRKPWPERPVTTAQHKEGKAFGGVIDTMVATLNQSQYTDTIQTLEDFVTRYTFTTNIDNAADWIYNTFQGFGLTVERHYFTIYSETKQNIIATIPGQTFPDEVVFITGHYDSVSGDPYNLAPGADDNASGTAAVIEVARIMSGYAFERTIKFACFAAEEQGLVGSNYYVYDIYNAGMNVVGCFNLDMIGYSGSDTAPPDFMIYTNTSSTALADKIYAAAVYYFPTDLEPFIFNDTVGASDHASFWQYGYQAILGIEAEIWGADFNPYYHSVSDLVIYCDLEYATNCTKATLAAVADLATPLEPVPSLSLLGLVGIIAGFSLFLGVNSHRKSSSY